MVAHVNQFTLPLVLQTTGAGERWNAHAHTVDRRATCGQQPELIAAPRGVANGNGAEVGGYIWNTNEQFTASLGWKLNVEAKFRLVSFIIIFGNETGAFLKV